MRLFISLISFMLLTACASTPMSVYLDAPENSTQVKKPVTIKVHEITTRALNKSLAYPMGVRKSLDGYKKVSTLNPKFSRRSVLEKYNFLKKLNKGDRAYVDFLGGFTKANATLDNEDISIFELKIIGISSGVETVVSKRFTGPVKRFNWVELFENKVPKDKSGYLLAGTAYLNYIPIFERPSSDSSPAVIEKEHKQYLVPIPIMFSVESEYRDSISGGVIYPERRNLCLFGAYWHGPMAKIHYSKPHLMENGAHIFSSGSDFLQSIIKDSGNSCERNNDTANDIFENKIIKIGGKFYPHAYLLNKNFVSINEMINTKLSRKRLGRKKIKQAAMHLAYKDDSALHEINRTMSDARSALGELSLTCKRSAKSTKSLANAWSKLGISRSDKDRRYGGHAYHFGNIKKRIEYYQNGITKATVRFEKLVKQQDGIQASTRSLEEYSTEVSMIPQSLNSAKVFCAQLGSAVSALGGVSSRSTPSFMSMLGGVLQDSYRKSINSRSGYSSSSSSAPKPGTVESLNSR